MALPGHLISWLNENDSTDQIELYLVSSCVFDRLRERGASLAEIDAVFRSLAPLEFHERHAGTSPWDCFFAPKMKAEDGRDEFPNLAALTNENVDDWVEIADSVTHPRLKARFADAVWELGRKLRSSRKDLYRFGRMASESYLELAGRTDTHPIELINQVARAVQIAMQLKENDLIDRGYEFLMRCADSVEQAHIGLWSPPFDRLLPLNGLSAEQRNRILDRHSQRFEATVASGDIFRMTIIGSKFAKYFYDRQQYQRAKEITFAYGEAVLKSADTVDASIAAHHIEGVLEAYRAVGLKDETDRVRLLLEAKGKGVLAGMKSQRVKLKLDLDAIESAIAKLIDVKDPLAALYRLASNCAPNPERLEAEFEAATEGLIFHRLLPVSIIGDDGLTVTMIGTYDQDKEGRLVMELARDMSLKVTFFLSGLDDWKKKFELGGIPDTPSLFDSLLVPSDRVTLFQDGLQAFEREDYVKCIHVLVFQVENSMRELLKLLGRPVTKSTDDGHQPKNMNDVLHDSVVKETLDSRLWSFLKVLYTDNRGINLRNLVAHGVAPASAFNRIPGRHNRKALASLAEESQSALSDINNEVAGVKLMRQRRVDAVRDAMTRARYVEIRGEAGVGKSGVLRRLAEDLNTEAQVLVLSPNRIIERGWLSMKAAIEYDGRGRDLMAELSLSGAAIVFIDNLDFFRAEEQTTVRDIVRFASQAPNVWVVVTARVEFGKTEPNWLPNDVLTILGQTDSVLIEELDDAEVSALKERAQRLSQLLSDTHPARAIVRNLFRLSRLANRSDSDPWPATEAEMAKQWWDLADGKNDAGLRERSRLLRRLTEHLLSSTQPYDATAENAEALNHLAASGSLRDYGNDRVTFRHDVLREWAIANFVFGNRGFGAQFQLVERASPDMARGAELAARIALEQPEGLKLWQEILASLTNAHETWRRAVLLALVRSELSIKILAMVTPVLLENDGALFKDLARYVTAVEFESAAERMRACGLTVEGIPPGLQVPRNSSCAHLVGWLLLVSDKLPPSAVPDAVKVYSAYLIGTLGNGAFAPLILQYLYHWLETIEADRESNPYGFTNNIFDGAIPGHQLKVTFGPSDTTEQVRALLMRAATRLGPPDEDSDLGDPRLMAVHALNVLDRDNWKEVRVRNSEGQEQTLLQYQSPEAEVKQLEPIQKEASPRLEESNQQFGILNALYASEAPTPDFLVKATAWAQEHTNVFENRPEFDGDGKYLTSVEAVISAATLLARYGTLEQLSEHGPWMRGLFARVHEGDSDPVYLMRNGLRFNPRAVAFVGQTLLLQRTPEDQDIRRLLEFASASGYASAHGFGVSLAVLEQVNPLLIPAVLRCAFAASVRLDLPWGLAEEEKEKSRVADQKRIQEQIATELAWLETPNSEPAWPEFPIQKIRPRDYWRNGPRDHAAEADEYHSVKLRVDYQRAALWLKQARSIYEADVRPWLRAVVSTYAEWTCQANGFEQERDAQYDGQPDGWNEVYFELAAKCAAGLSSDALDQELQGFFAGLPDESLCDCLPIFQRSADQAFFEKNLLSTEQIIQIRTLLMQRLSETRVFGGNKDRDEASAEMHLARALGPICFNDHNSIGPSKCYLPPSFIPRADPFLPLLENFVGEFRSPFLAAMYLNFMEVAPRADQLTFIVGCVEQWLERFPDSNRFWIEMSFGGRIGSLLATIFHASPEAFEPAELRSRVDKILTQLVGLGVGQAHEMETLLYQKH